MPGETVEVVRGQFEAVNRRDFAAAMDAYAEDVELVATDDGVRGGTFRGKAAVGEWFADWLRTFEKVHFEWLEAIEVGDAMAIVARHTAQGRLSGIDVADTVFFAYWVRDGKVTRVRSCATRDEALAAVRGG